MALWQIRLLGGLCVESEAHQIQRFRTQKTAALLAYLACHPGPQSREVLATLFWPDNDPHLARHNLRVALSALRRQLEPAGRAPGSVLRGDRNRVGLDGAAVATDVAAFEAALARADWLRAVELYGGALLAGFYDEWVLPEQRRLEELFFGALRRAVRELEARGDIEGALRIAGRGPVVDPLREEAHRDLMRLHARAHPALALRHYHELEARLQSELGCAPDAATRALAAQVQNALARVVVTAPPDEAALHAPAPLTRFFGRESEVAALHALLEGEARLITLTGSGGVGKSRLALEAVRHLPRRTARWPGGIWWVSLADLPDASLLAGALLDALKVRPAPDLDPCDELASFLARQPTLLLLDSFESLVEAGASFVGELLARVAHLKCLVTSRRTLGLAGERELWVAPLPVPDPQTAAPAALLACASARLFADRAQAVQSDFAVTLANATVIAQLCVRLEGIPLALELAAARAGALSPSRMLGLLDQRFELLVSRKRDLTARHRTLRAAIGWSFDLLEPAEQRFFAALSVFRGGCTLEAAQSVCGDNALESLETLRESSLLAAHENGGEMRFGNLDSIREFAAEQLAPDERAQLERRHAEFFVGLAETVAPAELWFARLGADADNLRAALEWSLANDSELALRLAGALLDYWERRAQIAEAQGWLERARVLPGPADLRAKVWFGAGRIAFVQCDALAQAHLEAALELFDCEREREAIAASFSMLGVIVWNRGQFEAAAQLFERQLKLWRDFNPSAGDGNRTRRCGIAHALSQLGNLAAAQRDFDAAQGPLQEAETHFRALGDACGLAYVQDALGQIALARGDRAGARELIDASLELYRGAGEGLWSLRALWGRGHLARDEGDDATALALYHESLALARRKRNRMGMPYLLEAVAVIEIARGRAERAALLLGATRALRDAIGMILMPIWKDDYECALSNARAALGDAAFERAWARGLEWNWEAAVDYALAENSS